MVSTVARTTKAYKLKQLGIKDINDQMARYEQECGEVRTRQASPEELERYRKELKYDNLYRNQDKKQD